MKHLSLTTLFILALLISAAPAAQAQFMGEGTYEQASTQNAPTVAEQQAANTPGISTPYTPTPAAAGTPTPFEGSPKLDEPFAKIMNWIASLFAWLVGVAVITLDNVVYYTVVKMGDYVNNLSAIGVTWTVMRDIGNIFLIFGFIFAGIATIINYDLYGWGKKMLPMLLVAAIFLNFSLFIAEAVIDTGNLFATQFYTQINGGQPASAKNFDLVTIKNEGISNKIMSQLGLATIYSNTLTNSTLLKAGHSVFVGFMSIILFLVAAFVFFSLAFVLIARFVILLFLIIVAPIGFAGLAVPKLEATAKKWWHALFEQTVTAPVLLLLLYIALAVITDVNFLAFGPKGDWTGFVPTPGGSTNFTGFASLILSFLVAMGLLLAVVILSKKMSAFGAGWATKTAGAASFGLTGLAGRYTVGLGSNYLAKKARSSRLATIPIIGTGITRGLEGIAGSSFDVRGVKRFGGLKAAGVEAGEAQKGGYKEALKKGIESRTKYASDLRGKEFKDLSAEEQLAIGRQENEIAKLKKEKTESQKAGTLTQQRLGELNKKIELAETKLDKMHKDTGTETGRKLQYGGLLGSKVLSLGGFLSANAGAAKKIKEEARKSKDDKDLDALRKALKKAGGGGGDEEEAAPATPPTGGGGTPPAGGGGGGAPAAP